MVKQRVRSLDPRIDHLHDCVEELKAHVGALKTELARNTEVTEQVRDILGTFKVTMAVGKWIGAAGAATAGLIAVLRGWKS